MRVYEYSNNSWTQLGSDIDGEAAGDGFGFSVAINDAGNRIAIGGIFNDSNGTDAGHVKIYDYENGSWNLVQSEINGESPNDRYGIALSLNSSGNRIIIGSKENDGNGSAAGHVRIFDLKPAPDIRPHYDHYRYRWI